ncbi:MAG: dihydroorotate dehydrogenase electron transfer subunit [Muribaculaceae bacterium]|nr:dihydroorotate dehydrogenase electron transfer subunit [Muribaculaceae bacterium]
MKKILDMQVIRISIPAPGYAHIVLAADSPSELPECTPGQFVQVQIPDHDTFLRRPISICDVDPQEGTLTLLVRDAGRGTRNLCHLSAGQTLNLVLPLGHGFSVPENPDSSYHPLLVGGGVGVAPLLYLARAINARGVRPDVILGARSAADVLLKEEFERVAHVFITTNDGSEGVHGLVTDHPAFKEEHSVIYCCGPTPMMKAVAAYARAHAVPCFVSLENMMACGLGACLCCVEKTVDGHLCVCTHGPVFDINALTWSDHA